MNNKIDKEIRKSIVWAQDCNIQLIKGGARFHFNDNGNAIAACPIGSLLLMHNKVPLGIGSPGNYIALSAFPFGSEAAKILEVDLSWLYRFHMGFDRGYQIMFIVESDKDKKSKKDKEIKDDVSQYGIALSKEFFKKKKV
jgi:hypothetical protein